MVAFLILVGFTTQAKALTLDDVKERGYIKVGIYPILAPFTFKDDAGNYAGFDVDVIKKVAEMWGVRIEWELVED